MSNKSITVDVRTLPNTNYCLEDTQDLERGQSRSIVVNRVGHLDFSNNGPFLAQMFMTFDHYGVH